jgi:phosphoglucosamine mutase
MIIKQKKYFGTDGIRGLANADNMTALMAMNLGMAAGSIFSKGSHRHRVIIGKDTRLSCYMLESALNAGFTSVGMDVILVGPMPTPAVAMLTRSLRADLGVMISASHNPYQDNGIKLFGPDGFKISDELEFEIEKLMDKKNNKKNLVSPKLIGRATRLDDASGRYVEFVKNTFPKGKTLDGLKIVVDSANGAAYGVSRNILWELGAEVISLSVKPDGFNINENCGSTHPQNLVETVLKEKADIGIALDGDADRLLIVDNLGNIIEGDQIIAAIACDFQQQQKLSTNKIVATSMSNLGLEHYINSLNLELVRTQVGDRYVSQAMRQVGANVGGEQSGHIILGDYSTTGDGLVAALQLLNIIISKNKTAAEVCRVFEPLPQILRNVTCTKNNILQDPKVQSAITAAEIKFNGQGRILVRNSGTQAIVRIMAENSNEALMQQVVDDIAQEIINA